MRFDLSRGLRYAALGLAPLFVSAAFAESEDGIVHLREARSELLRSGTPHSALFDITAHGSRLFMSGVGGQILRSEDGGLNWMQEQAPTELAYLGISAAGDHAVAVGQMGAIAYRTQDGQWKAADSGTPERLFDVAINESGVGVAVGAFGALLRTDDGGQSWQNTGPSWKGVFRDGNGRLGDFFTPSLYAVQIDEAGKVIVGGELSLLMTSDDGGKTWVIRNAGGNDDEGIEATISSVDVRSDGIGFAVGQEGLLLKTADGGVTWESLPRPTHANLLGVASKPDGTVVLTGMRDMQISRDAGRTFDRVYGNGIETGWFHGVVPAKKGHALTVGVAGKLLRIIN